MRAAKARQPGSPASPGVRRAPAAPDVDRREQEQPDYVDEMPIPGGSLEAEMLTRREVALVRTDEADGQKDRPDDDMEAVKARRHEEGRAVDAAFEGERRVGVLPGLDAGEGQAEQDRQPQSELQAVAVAVNQRMVSPGDG